MTRIEQPSIPLKHPRAFSDGFAFLFRGARELWHLSGVWWLMGVPVLINLALFAGLVVFLMNLTPALVGWLTIGEATWWLWSVLAWVAIVAIYAAVFLIYAFLFSIIAEILGAPFYEEIGARVDKRHGVAIVERAWYQEVWLAVGQESRKLVALVAAGLVIFVLQFLPGVGQVIGVVGGALMLVITLGADAVGPPLARRGLTLGDRRRWVIKHLMVVCGLGTAKAIGLIIPILNIVVLPIAAVAGTLLVQTYEQRSANH